MEYSMDVQHANGTDVFRWFSAGAREVASHVKHLNLINVFPVADGDTGTNLTTTLRAMVESSSPTPSFANTLQKISQSGLEGARGNSGIIFASYINGLAVESSAYEKITVAEFARAAFRAIPHLYAAVDNPREGTLMSIIRDWATFIQRNAEAYRNFPALFEAAYRIATVSLEKTKTQLEVLRKNNVVDSGAAGFVRFLEGINRVFSDTQSTDTLPEETAQAFVPVEESTLYRYCTEALVDTTALPKYTQDVLPVQVRANLHSLGDSLIVTHQGDRLKVHIHTNTPELLMEHLLAYGTLLSQKADDMFLQNRLQTAAKGGIGIITDSIADLPDEFLLAHNVSVVPMGVLVGETAYLDKLTIRLPQLFSAMDRPDNYPTSSQPEPGRIRALLSARLEQFDSLIVLSVAQKLSGAYQALIHAVKSLDTQNKPITVIDTKLNSGAQGLLVKLAAEMVAQSQTHDNIVAEINRRIPRTKIYVCLNTLAYAVRGGRVPNSVGKLGIRLHMRPIMSLDPLGQGTAFGVAFSQAGLTRKIIKLVQKAIQQGGIEAYSIVHGDNIALATAYSAQLTQLIGKAPEYISEISSAVALHAGPGTVAVCFTEKERVTT